MSFTPAHFGAFNGDIDMMSCLVSNGANLMIPNDEGVKVLHGAAQGDQAVMIYYLVKVQNIDIEDKDSSGNTALHWAVFAKSDNGTNFLLALRANPNSVNNDLLTPLHLSVKTIEDHKSIRIVKSLLLEGADRRAIDVDK